jgi:hypothetical protein
MQQFPPLGEIALGSLLLVVSTLIHGFGMYLVQRAFARYWPHNPNAHAHRQFILSGLILLMLVTHMTEVLLWSLMLLAAECLPNFRDAFYYASVTYTTLGYEDIVLPRAWRLLSPMMAISGLFAFGWTTGVLVSIVGENSSHVEREKKP